MALTKIAPMKAAAAATAMRRKATKKRKGKIAHGRLARTMVFKGQKEKTVGGLKRDDLMRSKRGKIVSKRKSAHGRRAYRHIEGWVDAIVAARSALHMTGFVAINGRTLQGKALYVKAKALCASSSRGKLADEEVPAPGPATAEQAIAGGA